LARQLAKQQHQLLHADLLRGGQYQRAALVLSVHPERQLARWLKGGLFLNMHNRMCARDFLEALRLRLMALEYTSMPLWKCGCRQKVSVEADAFHLLNCDAGSREVIQRHNKVVEVLADFCRKCVGDTGAVDTEVEFPRRGEYKACRMDIVITDGLGSRSLIDVTVVDVSARSYVIGKPHDLLAVNRRGAAFEQDYAVTAREGWKRTEAFGALEPTQMADFKPFGVALTGRLGGVARDVLGQMEQCHNARLGDDGPAAFRKLRVKFFLELGMVLARGTAKVAEAARSKIRRYGAAGGGHPPAVVHGDGPPLMDGGRQCFGLGL